MAAIKTKTLALDERSPEPRLVADKTWLETSVDKWPYGLLIKIRGSENVYARTMMHDYEPKVTFGVYQDGALVDPEEHWNPLKHEGSNTTPVGTPTEPARMDTAVTLALVECGEFKRLMTVSERLEDDAYLLSLDESRGRTLVKGGGRYRLANVSMYDSGEGGMVGNKFEVVSLGNDSAFLKKAAELLTERMDGWMQDNKSFASYAGTKKLRAVEDFMLKELKEELTKSVLKLVDKNPTGWGKKDDLEWIETVKGIYKTMDKDALILHALKKSEIKDVVKSLSVAEMKEYVARSLLSPRHLNCVVEALFEERGVISEKRKAVVAKESRQKGTKRARLEPAIEPRHRKKASSFRKL